jgi:hypothetical protein
MTFDIVVFARSFQCIDAAAFSIRVVTARGCEIIDTCEALTSTVWACARGHEALLGRRQHVIGAADEVPARDGLPCRRAGGRAGGAGRERALRCRQNGRFAAGAIVGDGVSEDVRLDVEVGVCSERHGVEDLGAVAGERRAGLGGDELQQALALVGCEGVDIDKRLDVGRASGGVGDDGPTVGVPDKDDRAGDGAQEAGEVRRVAREPAQRVGRDVDGVAVALEAPDDLAPLEVSAEAPCTSTTVGLAAVRLALAAAGIDAASASSASRPARPRRRDERSWGLLLRWS